MKYALKNILWATDFSEEAQAALHYAGLMARAFRARITALHVAPDFSPIIYEVLSTYIDDPGSKVDAVRSGAVKKIETAGKKKGIEFHKILVETGSASKKIVEAAEKEKAGLIVIGKTGLTGLEKILMGSVANRVLRNSPVPVLITGKKAGRQRLRKILVPTDFSGGEETERDFARLLAMKFGAELTLLHVLELHGHEFSSSELDGMFEMAVERLQSLRTKPSRTLKIKEDVIRAINAAAGIVEYGEASHSDMIVISTCTQSRLGRFLLGSTTEKVISYSPLPVFAIPAGIGTD